MLNHSQSFSSAAYLNHAKSAAKGLKLSTVGVRARDRRDWLQDMICQEYTRVEVTPPADGDLFNETTFYAWQNLRLSSIQSRGLTIEKQSCEPFHSSQDNYLAVILLTGSYLLEQNGREVFLQPNDMTIYDATKPHRIQSSRGFSKLLVSIPRSLMRDSVAGIEHCTAIKVSGQAGMGAVATHFIQSAVNQVANVPADDFCALSQQSLDLLTMAFTSVRPQNFNLYRSRSISLKIVKDFIARYLADAQLDTTMIASGTRFSARYMNDLFKDEHTSLMRYVWACRLEKCYKELIALNNYPISIIAFKWGFNDMSHFSRSFKKRFGLSPIELKSLAKQQMLIKGDKLLTKTRCKLRSDI